MADQNALKYRRVTQGVAMIGLLCVLYVPAWIWYSGRHWTKSRVQVFVRLQQPPGADEVRGIVARLAEKGFEETSAFDVRQAFFAGNYDERFRQDVADELIERTTYRRLLVNHDTVYCEVSLYDPADGTLLVEVLCFAYRLRDAQHTAEVVDSVPRWLAQEIDAADQSKTTHVSIHWQR